MKMESTSPDQSVQNAHQQPVAGFQVAPQNPAQVSGQGSNGGVGEFDPLARASGLAQEAMLRQAQNPYAQMAEIASIRADYVRERFGVELPR